MGIGDVLSNVADQWKNLLGDGADAPQNISPDVGDITNLARQAAQNTPFLSKLTLGAGAPTNIVRSAGYMTPSNLLTGAQNTWGGAGAFGTPKLGYGTPGNLLSGGNRSISMPFGSINLTSMFGDGPQNIMRDMFTPQAESGFTNADGSVEIDGFVGDPSKARGLDGAMKWQEMAKKAAAEAGVPWEVLIAIMGIESGGDPNSHSGADARGLMQVVPEYWQHIADKYGGDLFDPWTNIRTAADVLKYYRNAYGSWGKAAAGYLGSIDDNGNISSTESDMYGTTGSVYVQLFANNLAALGYGQSTGTGGAKADSALVQKALDIANTVIGKPYIWGGEGENGGFDCSGLVYYMYKNAGLDIGRDTAQGYYNSTTHVARKDLKPGDLIFYSFDGKKVDHVAIYIGNGQMIQASSNGNNVHIRSANEDFYMQNEVGYGRF